MQLDQLKAKFKADLNQVIDGYEEDDPQCAFASGMLVLLSALSAKDGASLTLKVRIMHTALREIGEERGWTLARRELKDD